MGSDKGSTKHNGGDYKRPNAGEEDDEDGEADEAAEDLTVRESAAEKGNWGSVGGTEEVEEDPSGGEDEEEEKGAGVGNEGKGEDGGDEDEVVDAKVGDVFAKAGGGFGEGGRAGEGGAIEKLGPGPALGESETRGLGDAEDERAQGRGVRGGADVGFGRWGRLGRGDGENGGSSSHGIDFSLLSC